MKPKVSIVTPSYNQAAFLEQTIRSVLDQGYSDLEYLLVDGASTDGSQAIIEKYADQLTWWISEPDSGQADAINKGFEKASGDIIAWLNSDDTYLPGTIEKAVTAFEQCPDVGLIYGDVLAIDEHGSITNQLKYKDLSLSDLAAFHVIGQPSVFIRRSVLEQAGYLDDTYHFLLDHHLWLRVAQLADIKHVPAMLSCARFHPASKNVNRASEFGREVFLILDWMQTQPGLAAILESDQRQISAGAHRLSAFYLLDGGDAAASLQEYYRCFRIDPPTAFLDWKHILSAVFGIVGLDRLSGIYRRIRSFLAGKKI